MRRMEANQTRADQSHPLNPWSIPHFKVYEQAPLTTLFELVLSGTTSSASAAIAITFFGFL